MRKKRNIFKSDADRESEWKEVTHDLGKHIKSVPRSADALARLVKKGCDEGRILKFVYAYCGGSPDSHDAIKTKFAFQNEQLVAQSNRLNRIYIELEQSRDFLNAVWQELGIDVHRTDFLAPLRDFNKILWVTSRGLKDLANRRISGRDHNLVYLARYVKIVAGRGYYEELAELVHTTRSLYQANPDKAPTANSIRRIVDRYGKLPLEWEIQLEEIKRQPQ